MSLRTWWIGVKLGRVEQNLKRLHARQKRIRGQLEKLAKRPSADNDAQRAKLETERERTTQEVAHQHAHAERLRAELTAEDNGHASA